MKEEASLNNNSREGISGFPQLANVRINTRIVTQEDFENSLQPLTDDLSALAKAAANALSGVNRIDDELSGLATVARTGSYNDLKDKPAIPTINLDDVPTLSSENAVKSRGIASAINEASNVLNAKIDSNVSSLVIALNNKADRSALNGKADKAELAGKVDATSEGNVASGKVVSDSIAEQAVTAEKLDQSIISKLGEINGKQNAVSGVVGNLAGFDRDGKLCDIGINESIFDEKADRGWVESRLSGKADSDAVESKLNSKINKVAGAISGNIALFGENGNLTDSQKAISSFATSEQGVRADNAISSINGKRSTDGALTLDASEVGALASSGPVVLNGSLTISDPGSSTEAVKYKHDGLAVYAGNGVHEISLPLSAGRLALESQLSAVQTSVSGVTGNFAGFDENGNLCDLGINAGDFASMSALNNLTDNMRSLTDSLAELDVLKADAYIVDEIVENVEELSGSISGLNQTKADKTDINTLSGSIRNLSGVLSSKTDLITTSNLSTDLQRQIWELSSYHRGGTTTPLTLDPRKSYVMTDGTALSLELENQTGPGTVKICAYDADVNEIPYDESAPGTIDGGGSAIDWAPLNEVNAKLNSISSVLDDRLGYIDEINGVVVLSSDGNVYINSTGDIILRKNLSEITRRDGEAGENETFSVIEQLRKMHDVENICLPLSGGIINVIDGLSTLTEKTRHQHAFEFDGAVEVLSVLDSPKPYIENGEQIYWAEKFGELYASDVDMFVQRGELNLSDVVALKLSADFAKLSGHFTLVIRTDKNDIKSGAAVTLSSHEENKEFDFGTIDSYSISQTDTHSKSIWLNLSKTYFNKDRVNNAHLYYGEPENPWEIWDSWYRVINTEIPLGEDLTTHEFSAPYIAYWTDDPYASSYQEDRVEFSPIEHKIITEQYISTERVITNADLVEIYNEFESRDGKIGQLSASIQEENEARKKFVKMDEDSKISADIELLGKITIDKTLNNIDVGYPDKWSSDSGRTYHLEYHGKQSLGESLTYMSSIGFDTSSFDLIKNVISPAQLNQDTLSDCVEYIEYPDPDDPECTQSRLCLKKIDPVYWNEAGSIPCYIKGYGEVEQLGRLSVTLTEDDDPLKYCLNYSHTIYGSENFPNADQIYIPNTVKIIGDYAFSYIRGSREISIPDSVTEIGKRAFHQSGISSIRLPKGLKNLSKGLFAGCYSLESIEMPETIESIGSEAFFDVPFKGPIYIDENIKFISHYAFTMSPIDALYWESTKNPLETLSNLVVLANEEHEDEWDENNNLSDSIHTIYYPCDIDTSAWPTEISGIVCKPKSDFRLTTGTATIASYKPRYEQDVVNKKYVDDIAAEIEAGIIPQSAIDGIVSACATKEYVNNSVADLASTEFVNRSISAFATNRYVDYALSGKAGVEYVDNAVAEISSQTVTTARFDETISSVNAAIDNVPTKEYVNNAVSSSTNDMVSREFFDQTVSQLMGVINELSAKLQAIIDDDEPPTPPYDLSGTFTWTDENGEHTEYLSSLNSFTWTDDSGAHYYCNEHGLDNPDCPEYQEIISGDTTDENVLAWTDASGAHEVSGPIVMAWTDSNGSHTVNL